MEMLLDTHVFLWWVNDSPELSKNVITLITDEENTLYLSTASLWEMAIKLSLGKLEINVPLQEFIDTQMLINKIYEMPIQRTHVVKVVDLPFHHRDPFDRLLIAQALVKNIPVISKDKILNLYGVKRLW